MALNTVAVGPVMTGPGGAHPRRIPSAAAVVSTVLDAAGAAGAAVNRTLLTWAGAVGRQRLATVRQAKATAIDSLRWRRAASSSQSGAGVAD
jgi:hypothetical protein